MHEPLSYQRNGLPLQAVRLESLDSEKSARPGSGLVCKEDDGLYLYTCWHVASGIDMYDLKVPHRPPKRTTLNATCCIVVSI